MLAPFETLYRREENRVARSPLPSQLLELYGEFALDVRSDRPHVISNFVSTLDGVVSLGIPDRSGGDEISGSNQHDRALMGMLRAAASAVVVGAGTLRAVPRHLWTAEHAFPELGEAYRALRGRLGRGSAPLNVILTANGDVDLTLPVFASGEVSTLIVTTPTGAAGLLAKGVPPRVTVRSVERPDPRRLDAAAVLDEIAVCLDERAPLILVEGGPHVMGEFLAQQRIDELFLTLAPQVAGRDDRGGGSERPGLAAGLVLAPGRPAWSTLVSVHRAGSHLFLRYRFARDPVSERRDRERGVPGDSAAGLPRAR